MNSNKETKKRTRKKYIGIILLILLIAAFTLFMFFLRTIYPQSDETIIREAAAKIANKDPNDLTNNDFAKITKIKLKGKTRDIKLLEKFTNLEELDLQHVKIKTTKIPKWLISFCQRYRIKLPKRNYIDLSPLEKLSHLKKLDLYGGDFDDITPVSNIRSMEDLNISGTQIYDINSLQKLTNLKKLNLFAMGYSDITPLARFTNLEELNLIGTKSTNIEPLRNLRNLKILVIYDSKISDIEPLRNLKNLQTLYISNTKITNFEPLKELTNLEKLYIDGTQMACVEYIKDLQNLQILHLGGNGLNNLEPLKQLTKVKTIQFNSDNIKPEQIEDLEKALPETKIFLMYIS